MRRKLAFLTPILLLFHLIAMGQFKRGDRMVGATIGSAIYNSGSTEVSFPSIPGYTGKITSYDLSFNPSSGWFISENTVVGLELNINPSGQKSRYSVSGTAFQQDKSNSFDIGLGAFGRKYLKAAGDYLPFGQFGFNLGISTMSTEGFRYFDSSPDYKTTYTGKSSGGFFANAAAMVGITKLVGEYTGLDLALGYIYSYSKNTLKTTTLTDTNIDGTIDQTAINEPTTKFTNHGFRISLGFQVFLQGKKNK